MISVLYSGNKKYFEGLLLSVLSVVDNTKEPIHFYVMTMDLTDENPKFDSFSDEQINVLNEAIKKRNSNSLATKLDVTDLYKKHLISGKNHKTGYTPYTLLRLLFDLCEGIKIPEKVIYLDVDTMCLGDIKELYNTDLEGKDVAMVRDHMAK